MSKGFPLSWKICSDLQRVVFGVRPFLPPRVLGLNLYGVGKPHLSVSSRSL